MDGATTRGPGEVIGEVTVERTLLQDFRPVAQSLEMELAGYYWDMQGVRPFVENQVPYAVNNSGWAPEAAARVLLANCLEEPEAGQPIVALELGAGLGLFARQLLDAFRELCIGQALTFYERLIYYVTDYSQATVEQWDRGGQFAGHGKHVVIGRADAMRPGTVETLDGRKVELAGVRAIFANYVLDTLPIAVVRRSASAVEQLCVRTWLGRLPEGVSLPHQLTEADIVRLAGSCKVEDRRQLVAVLPLLEFEVAMRDIGTGEVPYANEALEISEGKRVIAAYGAIQSLEESRKLLHRFGFVLVNDYGIVRMEGGHSTSPQRFGGSVATGLNFEVMEGHLSRRAMRVIAPPGDEARSIHSRLLALRKMGQTEQAFCKVVGDAEYQKADSIAAAAAEMVTAGRLEDALAFYQRNIARCPTDWHTLAMAAEFLCQQLRKFEQSLELARSAIAINPWYSAFLWNTLGNALFCLARYAEAHEAYLKAEAIDGDDPQTNLNLAYSFSQSGQHRRALAHIAIGLAHDRSQRFRSHLLDKQQHILTALGGQWAAEANLLNQRYAAFASGG